MQHIEENIGSIKATTRDGCDYDFKADKFSDFSSRDNVSRGNESLSLWISW